MISLGQYCQQNTIDGHMHLFDNKGIIPYSKDVEYVGFCDVDPKEIGKYADTISYYEDFINNHYTDKITLLAVSTSASNMIEIHKKWPKIIKGFGEVKCYNHFDDVDNDVYYDLKLDRLSKYWELGKYADKNSLPIYIHYSLYNEDNVEKFSNFISRYPNATFVLCHCGMDKETDNDFCYHNVMKLMKEHHNLWVDASWEALDYFSNNPFKLTNMDRDRIIFGSDMSRKSMLKLENLKKEWDKIHNLDSMVKSDRNIKKLFENK